MKRTSAYIATLAVIAAALVTPTPALAAVTATQIDLQPESAAQTIDGFGYSAAFQRTDLVNQLSPEKKAEVVELLLGDSGADPSILRLGIGAQSPAPYDKMLSIQPTDPGGPTATPNYQWDGDDNGQVWFAQEAEAAGVEYIYGNAWSAPAYMKTNNSAANGGLLCGVPGTSCPSGDWTDAYANYLVAWADFYKQEGVTIDGLAFTNEPDYTTTYESMRFSPTQAADFAKTFGPVAHDAGYEVLCCDSYGWGDANGKSYHAAIQADSEANAAVDILTAHSYASRSDSPFETSKPIWMSEYAASASGQPFNVSWDQGTPGVGTDGIKMADHMMDTLTKANATGYLWWLGVSSGASASMMVVDVANDTYTVGSRYYAMSAFSKFVRPGAQRFDAIQNIAGLKTAAFDNTDGSRVVQLLNSGTTAISTDIDMDRQPVAYVNDNSHKLESVADVAVTADGTTALELPARSLVTLVLPAEDGGTGIPVEATVGPPTEPGALALTVADYGDGVVLEQAQNAGDRLSYEGDLPGVTVTDSRNAEQAAGGGWAVTGRSSDFTSDTETVTADHFGWTPELLQPRTGVTAGPATPTALDGGTGLSDPASLGSATSEGRFGSAEFGARLDLELPVETDPGTYRGSLTVSLFPVD